MKKERIIMLISSVFVLTALTMTGFYVKEKNEADKDGYVVDMSALEKKTEEKTKEIAESVEQNQANDAVKGNDLDYDPNFQEASSGDVTNTWDNQKDEEADLPEDETANKDIAEENVSEDDKTETEENKPEDVENQQS